MYFACPGVLQEALLKRIDMAKFRELTRMDDVTLSHEGRTPGEMRGKREWIYLASLPHHISELVSNGHEKGQSKQAVRNVHNM